MDPQMPGMSLWLCGGMTWIKNQSSKISIWIIVGPQNWLAINKKNPKKSKFLGPTTIHPKYLKVSRACEGAIM